MDILSLLFGKRANAKPEVQNGNTCWFNKECELHRENGPAIEYTDGRKSWYLNNHKTTRQVVEQYRK